MPRSRPASANASASRATAFGSSAVEAQVGRRHDLARVATERRAVLGEHALQARVLRHRAPDEVPVLGDSGRRAQRALLAAPADADRWVRSLDGFGLAVRVGEGEVGAGVVRAFLGQQGDDHIARLVEAVHALLDAEQVDPVRVRLVGVPPGAEPELQPAVRDLVERCRHVGEDGGVAVGHARHEHADAEPARCLGQRREREPTLEARAGAVAEDRLEVVERPPRLEDVDVVGRLPDGEHVVPGRGLRRRLERKAHGGARFLPRTAGAAMILAANRGLSTRRRPCTDDGLE